MILIRHLQVEEGHDVQLAVAFQLSLMVVRRLWGGNVRVSDMGGGPLGRETSSGAALLWVEQGLRVARMIVVSVSAKLIVQRNLRIGWLALEQGLRRTKRRLSLRLNL
jgi:hypothetical protein